jgi:hypothetical protein
MFEQTILYEGIETSLQTFEVHFRIDICILKLVVQMNILNFKFNVTEPEWQKGRKIKFKMYEYI